MIDPREYAAFREYEARHGDWAKQRPGSGQEN